MSEAMSRHHVQNMLVRWSCRLQMLACMSPGFLLKTLTPAQGQSPQLAGRLGSASLESAQDW